MRRQALDAGALAPLLAVYGLRPWELDRLTGDEVDALIVALNERGG